MRRAAPQPKDEPSTKGRDGAAVLEPYEAPDHDCPTCGMPTSGVLCTSCATQ